MENNVSVGRIAAEELIHTECKRIAFAAHSFDYEAIQDRQLGVEKAVAQAGDGVTFQLIDSGGLMVEDGRQLGMELSDRAEQMRREDSDNSSVPDIPIPDGIVAGNDTLAMGLLASLHERGVLRVPDDISVIGTEDMWFQAISPMPLTVVQAPGIDMGRKAMTQLLDYAENPVSHVHGTTLIEPTLIRRASTRA